MIIEYNIRFIPNLGTNQRPSMQRADTLFNKHYPAIYNMKNKNVATLLVGLHSDT